MKWTENEGLAKRILADIAGELQDNQKEYLTRFPHVSELIYCLTASWYNRFSPLPHSQRETLLFLTGIGLETTLLRPHKKPSRGEFDGIYWSADFLDYVEGLGELKSTRISAKRPPEELPETWKRQVLSYMYGIGVYEADLVALHLMGNYAPPFPMLKAWHIEATRDEVEANHQWLVKRKEVLLHHAEIKEPPKQFTYNEDWECENCRYKLICEGNETLEQWRGEQATKEKD